MVKSNELENTSAGHRKKGRKTSEKGITSKKGEDSWSGRPCVLRLPAAEAPQRAQLKRKSPGSKRKGRRRRRRG